jgi:hypothetical protein
LAEKRIARSDAVPEIMAVLGHKAPKMGAILRQAGGEETALRWKTV